MYYLSGFLILKYFSIEKLPSNECFNFTFSHSKSRELIISTRNYEQKSTIRSNSKRDVLSVQTITSRTKYGYDAIKCFTQSLLSNILTIL